MHEGKLKSGGSGRKVSNPKQAIAIGLSEAREEGKKVPKNSSSGESTSNSSSKKSASPKPGPKKRSKK